MFEVMIGAVLVLCSELVTGRFAGNSAVLIAVNVVQQHGPSTPVTTELYLAIPQLFVLHI